MHGVPSEKVRSAREAAKLPTRRKAVRDSMGSGWSLSSDSKQIAIEERPEERRRVRRGGESRYGEIQGDRSGKTGCRKQKAALNFARDLKVHRSLIARMELVLVRLIAVTTFRLL